jgi:hypothetical protein
MPRKSVRNEVAAPPIVPVIAPTAVYTVETFRATFGLRQSSLRREVKEGRLKVYKRCGRYFITGEQVLAWLRGEGETCRACAAAPAAAE